MVGTGGDRAHTVNISTMAALVVAGAGVRVVKHGNRAASSMCGTADLLEHLGIPLDLGPDEVARCVGEAGIGFCFAPRFHSGLRHTAVPRREMGIPTAFNFLGPLANPAQPRAGAIGCADARMAAIMAGVFAQRGDSVLVLHGEDGLDEFTTTAPTRVWAITDGAVRATVIDAADLGIARASAADLRGGDVDGQRRRRPAPAGRRAGPGPRRRAASTRRRRWWPTTASRPPTTTCATAWRPAWSGRPRPIDSGAAAAALARWVEVAQSAAASPSSSPA